MNPINKNNAYLWDMLQASQRIQDFIQDILWEDYQNNILLQSAVERQLEILGEAARRISLEFQQQHPDIPWSDIIGQRNILAHQYEKVDQKRIWQTITIDLNRLTEALKPLIPPLPRDQ